MPRKPRTPEHNAKIADGVRRHYANRDDTLPRYASRPAHTKETKKKIGKGVKRAHLTKSKLIRLFQELENTQ